MVKTYTDTDRFVTSVRKFFRVDIKGLAMNLISPAGIVSDRCDGSSNINILGVGPGFA
jgi:hypothetical protein